MTQLPPNPFLELNLQKDPIRTYYTMGYADVKTGRKGRRVPQSFKLAYSNGKSDALAKKSSRYGS